MVIFIVYRVRLMHMLGEGAFGCVFYAEMKPSPGDDCSEVAQPVAVKMLKCKKLVNQFKLLSHYLLIMAVGLVSNDKCDPPALNTSNSPLS